LGTTHVQSAFDVRLQLKRRAPQRGQRRDRQELTGLGSKPGRE
jgi:hypothetical protein